MTVPCARRLSGLIVERRLELPAHERRAAIPQVAGTATLLARIGLGQLGAARAYGESEEDAMTASLIVTSPGFIATRRTRRALPNALPGAFVQVRAFTGVFKVEAEGDAVEPAASRPAVYQPGAGRILSGADR